MTDILLISRTGTLYREGGMEALAAALRGIAAERTLATLAIHAAADIPLRIHPRTLDDLVDLLDHVRVGYGNYLGRSLGAVLLAHPNARHLTVLRPAPAWDEPHFQDALEAARARGVDVQVIETVAAPADGHGDSPTTPV